MYGTLAARPDVNFEFNLPHGPDADDTINEDQMSQYTSVQGTVPTAAWSFNQLQNGDDTRTRVQLGQHENDGQELNHRQFPPRFSDDGGSGEAFERSWPSHQARKQAANAAKGTKSPRRSEDQGEDPAPHARAKKPRQSLFGGADEEMETDKQVDSLFVSATPGHGLGHYMSSFTLDQQQGGDEVEQPTRNGFGLAYSDIGSAGDSPALSDDKFVIAPDTTPYYELRRNINRQKTIAHIDTDKSGDFDPDQEAKERATKLVHAKVAKKDNKETRKKKGKNGVPRDYVMKCIVKLPFDAFSNVRNIKNDEQRCPEDWSEIDSEQGRELEEYRAAFRVNTPDRGQLSPLEDPAGKFDEFTGHPEARGCKQCRKLEQPCSMVKDGTYPCEECTEDGSECQPIQEIAVKDRCKQCDQPICDHCADNDHICEALPPQGYKASRINIEEVIWGPDRPHVACTACRKDKKRCTLKGKEDKPPCRYCGKNNLGCTFFHLPKFVNENGTAKKKPSPGTITQEVMKPRDNIFTTQILEREPTSEMEMEDGEGNKGMLTKITTSFAHPIRFQAPLCNFCEIPIFGMIGYFEREVHVIRWHNGLGYAEVGGGRCSDTGPTMMCRECTNHRVQIVACAGHEFEQQVDAAVDHDVLADGLNEVEPGGADVQYQLQRWCSLCFSPASYGCCKVQLDITGQEEMEVTGCHLRLCFACEHSLREDYGGDFDQMVTQMDSKPKISEADEILEREIRGKPRADVGFLQVNGLLMRTVMAMEE
ncbi:uncharacterized protein M421DRAFT_100320 [Didymella exigua CBS 183.55]|uniref:Zn(2)-C6 fungal-type domain-containing protein n=1 Tax=Didymella exigua CBS 183.55 TaxID=1150837 RepID=A0A6A5RL44_9PLEO|nr:uncharacterized protein M421DRAFT_100320 [Didymella exigua CBS 183.55]KAF1929151.1 hypothetical protein M421DRAFT_100320 [Didymella exigua CBS 183.55]